MPKSKRNKQISLTHIKKKGLEMKKNLASEVQSCVDAYENIYIYSVNDSRNSKLKEVRQHWRDSRFFFGRNKVMALALGRSPEEEYRKNLFQISSRLRGQCGLLFSNRPADKVIKWFDEHTEADFARTGNIAPQSLELGEGPLPQFSHSLEPHLRSLGMPTTLNKGVIHLIKPYQVCIEGQALTAENARILKLLGQQMAEFRITIQCYWSKDGTFVDVNTNTLTDGGDLMMETTEENEPPVAEEDNSDLVPDLVDSSPNKSTNGSELVIESTEEKEQPIAEAIDLKPKAKPVKRLSQKLENSPDEKSPILKPKAKPVKRLSQKLESSPDEKSPIFRALRNRVVKIRRKK